MTRLQLLAQFLQKKHLLKIEHTDWIKLPEKEAEDVINQIAGGICLAKNYNSNSLDDFDTIKDNTFNLIHIQIKTKNNPEYVLGHELGHILFAAHPHRFFLEVGQEYNSQLTEVENFKETTLWAHYFKFLDACLGFQRADDLELILGIFKESKSYDDLNNRLWAEHWKTAEQPIW